MSWKGLSVVDQKEQFVLEALQVGQNLSHICSQYGVSRSTAYRWIKRYRDSGRSGLEPASSRPASNSRSWSPDWRNEALRLRKRYPWGGKKLRVLLERAFPDQPLPAASTIDRWVRESGLSEPRRTSPPSHQREAPLTPAQRPGEVYCADFKGQFKLGDGSYCYPLTITDAYSRFIVGCFALRSIEGAPVRRCFERVFATYGVPDRIRTDNGTPFAGKGLARFSTLSVWWYVHGIISERIALGRPDQNGSHERMHRTLKRETIRPPATTRPAQQRRFDAFVSDYNCIRPHEAIDMQTPGSLFTHTGKAYNPSTKPPVYPRWYETRKVDLNGLVTIFGRSVFVGRMFKGHILGLEAIEEHTWKVYFYDYFLGITRSEHRKVKNYCYHQLSDGYDVSETVS